MPLFPSNEPMTIQLQLEQKKLLLLKVKQHKHDLRHAASRLHRQIQLDFEEEYWKEELRKKKLELKEFELKKLELKEVELGIREGNYQDLLSQLQKQIQSDWKKGILEKGVGT